MSSSSATQAPRNALFAWRGAADPALLGRVPSGAVAYSLVLKASSGETGFDRPGGDACIAALGDELVLLRPAIGASERLGAKLAGTIRAATVPRASVFVDPSPSLAPHVQAIALWSRSKAQAALAARFGKEKSELAEPPLSSLGTDAPSIEAIDLAIHHAQALVVFRFAGEWGLAATILSRTEWLAARKDKLARADIDLVVVASQGELPSW